MKNKGLAHRLNHAILMAFHGMVNTLPLWFIPLAGGILGDVAYLLIRGKRRYIVYKNLKIVLGSNENPKKLNRIFRASLQNLGKMILETTAWPRLFTKMDEWFTVEGEEYLKASLKKGKGVIAISIHLGSFTLICGKLARMGYTLYPIIRPPHNKVAAEFLDNCMSSWGVRYIPDKPRYVCVKKCHQVLRNNEMIFLTTDLNVIDKDAIFVEFLGYKVPAFKGPAVLAARTGAPVHPMFIVRQKGLHHKIIIDPPLSLKNTGNLQSDVVTNMGLIIKATEHYILKYPEQWLWLHDRWRRMRKIRE
ncbi:MAG TPA: hypothetical protein EYP21_04855 [Syntrophaceae bacterium]|nr:hypothetical protein [Syntrophaceae bacterium]